MRIRIQLPAQGTAVGAAREGLAFVAGEVIPGRDPVDLVLVLDLSDSTLVSSGVDVDGDGQVPPKRSYLDLLPFGKSEPEPRTVGADSLLALEIRAIQTLLAGLDPRHARVGLVALAGDGDPYTRDAEMIVPLGQDHDRLRAALETVRPPRSARTNLRDGIVLAVAELLRAAPVSPGGTPAARAVFLFSDGVATLPTDEPGRNRRISLEAAELAQRGKVPIHTFAVGGPLPGAPGSRREPRGQKLLREIAEITQGTYTPIEDPAKLESPLPRPGPIDVAAVALQNADTGARAEHVELGPEGAFRALVPARPGASRIAVDATLRDGSHSVDTFELRVEDGAPTEPTDPAQAEALRRLLAR